MILIHLPILFLLTSSWKSSTVLIQEDSTFLTNSTRNWNTRHYKNLFPVKLAYKGAKQLELKQLHEESDLFTPQGNAPTSGQGVLKCAIQDTRSLYNYWL